MFHWICPECGREIAPAMKECSFCDASGAAAPPPLPSPAEVVPAAIPVTTAVAEIVVVPAGPVVAGPVKEVVAEARAVPERSATEQKETHDPLRAAAEQLRSLQAQAHANALANGVNKAEAKAKLEAEAEAAAKAEEAKRVEEAQRAEEARRAEEVRLEGARAEAEAAARAEAEAWQAEAEARQAAEAKREAEAKAEAEARQAEEAKREAEAKAEAEARQAEEAKREAEAKAEAEARQAAEAKREAEAKAEAEARQAAEAKREAEAKAEAEARQAEEAKREAEAKAEAEARLAEPARREAEAKAEAEARAAEQARREAEATAEAEAWIAAEAKREEEAAGRRAREIKREPEAKAAAEAMAQALAKLQIEAKPGPETKAPGETKTETETKIDAKVQEVDSDGKQGPPALPIHPVPSLQLASIESDSPAPASHPEAIQSSESMVRDLAALASINEPSVAPEPIDAPRETPGSMESLDSPAFTNQGSDAEPSTTPLGPLQMGLLQASPSPVALLAAPELEARAQILEPAPVVDALPQVRGLAAAVEVPGMKAVPTRPAVFQEPVALLSDKTAPASELTATVVQRTLPEPSFSLASREGHPSSVASRLKPRTSRPKVVTSDSAPQFHLPGPSIPPQLESVSEAGLTAAAIGKMSFRSPKKGNAAGGKGGASSVKGWLVSLSVTAVLLAAASGVVYWATPSQTLASVRSSASKAVPETAAPDKADPEIPPTPTNSLSKQIEVTGFRFVTPTNKKPEIHYLVVNHSALALNDVTVFVTLHSGNAKPGQPPLSRFSFRAPNVPPFESKEMSSTIEKITQPIALPEWQDVKAEVAIGQ